METQTATLASAPEPHDDPSVVTCTVTMSMATDLSTPIPVEAFVPHQVAMVLCDCGKDTLRRARLADELVGSVKVGLSWHYPVSSLVAAGLLSADRLADAAHFVDARHAAVTVREQEATITELRSQNHDLAKDLEAAQDKNAILQDHIDHLVHLMERPSHRTNLRSAS